MTIIDTHITQDTTWGLMGSPYVICLANDQIPEISPGVTLTIENGVTVQLGSGWIEDSAYVCRSLINNGTLIAEGVTFTYWDKNGNGTFDPFEEGWLSLFLKNGSNSIFNNCIIEYGGVTNPYDIAFIIDASAEPDDHIDIAINGGTIRPGALNPCKVGGIWFTPGGGHLNLDGVQLTDFTDNPVVVEHTGSSTEIIVNECLIQNSREHGLVIRSGTASIINCTFRNNSSNDVNMWDSDTGPESVTLINNSFDGNDLLKYPVVAAAKSKINTGITSSGNVFDNYPDNYRYAWVCGNIPADTNAYWGEIGISYAVPPGHAEVNQSSSLTIAQGQFIVLTGDRLLSMGDFQAQGTADDPITFVGEGRIEQEFGHFLLEHCIFDGTQGLKGYSKNDTDISENISFVVRNSIFTNVAGDAIYLQGNNYNTENTVIEYCSFIQNRDCGLYFSGWSFSGYQIPPASASLKGNIIAANGQSGEANHSGIRLDYFNVIITNCTIVANNSWGIMPTYSSNPILVNCILWDNLIYEDSSCTVTITYSCVPQSTSNLGMSRNTSNIHDDPLFGNPQNYDYYLKSTIGRWEPASKIWVTDDVTSPCIDTGDPASPFDNEPLPNGGRMNMGAYGNTIYASKSPNIPDISLLPDSHDFGEINVGSSSAPQVFTVGNIGTADLLIGTIDISGTQAAEFTKQNDNCSNQALIPGQDCTLEVVFSPASGGAKEADLTVPSNDPDTTVLSAPLSGTGKTAGVPRMSVTPIAYDFGQVYVQTVSRPVLFTITNKGKGDLVLGAILLTGPHTVSFRIPNDYCSGRTLKPGENATLSIVFCPREVCYKSAFLAIPSNDPKRPNYLLPLMGKAIPCYN